MYIPQRPIELLTRLYNALLYVVHFVYSVENLVDRQFLEHHVVVGQGAGLVAEEVLNTAQLLGN
jgi:hypothetical protein